MSKSVLCDTCGYPVARMPLPIIWPSVKLGRRAYCSVECFEKASNMTLPEPMRSAHLDAERNDR